MIILSKNLISTQLPLPLVIFVIVGFLVVLIMAISFLFIANSFSEYCGFAFIFGVSIMLFLIASEVLNNYNHYETYYTYKVVLNKGEQIDLTKYKITGNEGPVISIEDLNHKSVSR